ncbi:hypothetical protein N7462_000537 [Penicillium macrosclerotiorum]|uniref:uncharacterized protein n=1 Tax=Penicillium macrosclerotiorum TaxID=303699 RepID=UPI0025481D69|nr:uncharacterized protein N7462_000537 [Penicillium macrosclerotiorum]KAJ5698532.1 hypothetical protein N7462_000537 [Penicillium macrosclerotiorum]
MKFSETLAISAALVSAASASPLKRTGTVDITFIGAADAQFTQAFPTDGSVVAISNVLSISHISSATDGVGCTFNGVDHSVTTVNGATTVDVGPPQTQISGTCHPLSGQNTPPQHGGNEVEVIFIGAADAKFSQWFPTDGSTWTIDNALSISHIEVDASGVSCTFGGIDNSVTSITGPNTVDVGPPQTQIQGSCHI